MGVRDLIRQWLIPPGYFSWFASNSRERKPQQEELTRRGEVWRDRFTGESCFILGSGSSVQYLDLTALARKNVITVSNSFVHPLYSSFNNLFHVLPPLLRSHSQYYSDEKFANWLREMEERVSKGEFVLHYGDRNLVEQNGIFKGREITWVEYYNWDEGDFKEIELGNLPSIWSVSELAISFALLAGFKRIFLLGFDHDWFNGPMVYFYDKEKEHAVQPKESQLLQVDAEFQMRRHARIFKKYKILQSMKRNIFNVSPGKKTYVDVFPVLDLTEALSLYSMD